MVSKYERGQAIVLIAFAIVGLIAIVALAIDGGNVFLDRRRAQNAADTAAYASALAKIEAQKQIPALTKDAIKIILNDAAIVRATSNGYPASTVTAVNNPPLTGCGGSTNPYILGPSPSPEEIELKEQYIQVVINSTVNTYFAPIVGISTLSNCVEAIARAKPGDPLSLCHGSLICALSPTDKNAVRAFGGANVTLTGAGAFSNSTDAQALYMADNLSIQIAPNTGNKIGVTAMGGINAPVTTFPQYPYSSVTPFTYPLPDYMIPKYTCDYTYATLPDNLPGGLPYLKAGVYCVTGNFKQADYTNGTTDGTKIGGVTIVMVNNGLSWAGTLNIKLSAPPDCNVIPTPPDVLPPFCSTPGPHPTPQTAGLLIYLPYGNKNNTVKFAGSGALDITGTILAPDIGSLIHYSGNYATATFKSQLVGWNIEFGGTAAGGIYLPPIIFVYHGDARVELVK